MIFNIVFETYIFGNTYMLGKSKEETRWDKKKKETRDELTQGNDTTFNPKP